MTTEAKMKKLEEDVLLLEDQNSKFVKVKEREGYNREREELIRQNQGGFIENCFLSEGEKTDGGPD